MIKRIGDVLTQILDANLQNTLKVHANLYKSWKEIILEAFLGKTYKNPIEYESELRTKNRINAEKVSDHSKITSIVNNVMLIEAEHSGWIQILQSKQNRILSIVQREYKDLQIKSISLILTKNTEQKIEQETEQNTSKEELLSTETKTDYISETNNSAYDKIKDEHLKNILRRLEKQIKEQENSEI